MQKDSGSFLERIKRINHFWLKKGESRKIVFLEDIPNYSIRLHSVPIINKFKKIQYLLVPCSAGKMGVLDCHFCNSKEKFYLNSYKIITIFDYTPYINQKGESVPSGKKILYMRKGFIDREIKKIHGTKQFAGFNAKRGQNDEDSLGSGWEFLGYLDISKMYPDQIEPYNIYQIFAPPSNEDIQEIIELNKMAKSLKVSSRGGAPMPQPSPQFSPQPPVVTESKSEEEDPEPYF